MAKRFLTGIVCPEIEISNNPVNPLDGTNKQYVDLRSVPPGGSATQVLTKLSGTDYDVAWQTPSGGSGSGTLINIDMGSFNVPNGFIDAGSF